MVFMVDSPGLMAHYHTNLERYVHDHPGEVVRLELPFGSEKVSEQFFTKREYQTFQREQQSRLAAAARHDPMHKAIGGGVIGTITYIDIPKKMPTRIPILFEDK